MGNACSSTKGVKNPRRVNHVAPAPVPKEEELTTEKIEDPRLPPDNREALKIGEFFLSGELDPRPSKVKQFSTMIKKHTSKPKKKPTKKSIITRTESELYFLDTKLSSKASIAEYLRSGPPQRYRWAIWKAAMHPDRFFQKGLYETLVSINHQHLEYEIRKDINRTYPEFSYFTEDGSPSIGQDQLLRVLKAIGLVFPEVGYVQGMNFIIGFFLMMSGGSEIEAFWFYVALALDSNFQMVGYFGPNFPMVNYYVSLFHYFFQKKMPDLQRVFASENIPDPLWITKWLMTSFLYILPLKSALRVWDYMLSDNSFADVKIAIALLKKLKPILIKCDISGISDVFKALRPENQDGKELIDVELLIKESRDLEFPLKEIVSATKTYLENPSYPIPSPFLPLIESFQYLKKKDKERNHDLQKLLTTYIITDEQLNQLKEKHGISQIPEEEASPEFQEEDFFFSIAEEPQINEVNAQETKRAAITLNQVNE